MGKCTTNSACNKTMGQKLAKKERVRIIPISLQDIADTRGVTIHAVHAAIKRGKLDTRSLESIARYVLNIIDVYDNHSVIST